MFARFRREAERGASLDARGVLPVYEFGQDDHVAFFAMPLVEGISLARVLNHRRRHRAGATPSGCHPLASLPEAPYVDAVVRLLARVARALADAHAARVVHCDVKPANILVEQGVAGRAYLIDFGLGRDLDAMPKSRLRTVEGTSLYLAPEKLLGQRADEALCDIYSLGVTGFEALALWPPRTLPEELPRPMWARYLVHAEPPRLGTLVPGLPEDVGAIVERAMSRNLRLRYQSAVAMAEDLEGYLGGMVAR
jgi:serine/threonine protein kinase